METSNTQFILCLLDLMQDVLSSLHFTSVYAKYGFFICFEIPAHIIVFNWFVELNFKFNGNPSISLRYEAVVHMRLTGIIYLFLICFNLATCVQCTYKKALSTKVGETGYDACRAIRDAEHVDISNAVDMYDRWLQCSRSRDTRHMRRRSIAAAVQHVTRLENLYRLGVSGITRRF